MTEATETTETKTETDAPPPQAPSSDAESSPEVPDPNILGKMEPDEAVKVTTFKQKAQQMMQEIGRLSIRQMRLKQSYDQQNVELDNQKGAQLAQLQEIEQEAQKYLDNIGERFGIKAGEPWQALPDGTVRRVDPELLKAAQAAAQAQSEAQGESQEEPKEE